MKRQVKRNMVTFEVSSRDQENIQHGQLKRGGISRTKLFRDLLEEDRGVAPVLTVVPAMIPPKNYKAFIDGMKALEDTIEYVAETGLPNTYPGASEADRIATEKARARFPEMLSLIEGQVPKFILLGRFVACLEKCDVQVIKTYAAEKKASRDYLDQLSKDPTVIPGMKAQLVSQIAKDDGILAWFSAAGLLPPNS